MTRRLTLLTLAVCAALVPGVALAQPNAAGKKFAVLVGVNVYEHAKIRALRYAENDAQKMADELGKHGYSVTVLTGSAGKTDPKKSPTKANIERELQGVLAKCRKGDTVVIGFAGHGMQFEGQKDAFFMPADARPFKDKTDSMVSLALVYHELDASLAGMKVLFVDACRDDPNLPSSRGVTADSAPRPPQGVACLFSCSAGEQALEHGALQHGLFFYYLLEGLRGRAKDEDGDVTFGGLASYVTRRVVKAVPELFPDDEKAKSQHPNLKADYSAEPVLVSIVPGTLPSNPLEGTTAGQEREDNALKMKLVWCPAGSFTMGSPTTEKDRSPDEGPVPVTLSKGFWLGKFEVTQGQWDAVMKTAPWKGQTFVKAGSEIPATYIAYDDPAGTDDAVEFLKRLTASERAAGRLPVTWKYDLPTEAQWEYACRASKQTRFSFGDDETALARHAWYEVNADKVGEEYAHQVGLKLANAWGLHDMHGNVWEWCRDAYEEKLPGGRDPEVVSGSLRVGRGGCWNIGSVICRSANRSRDSPDSRLYNLGFRAARVPSSK